MKYQQKIDGVFICHLPWDISICATGLILLTTMQFVFVFAPSSENGLLNMSLCLSTKNIRQTGVYVYLYIFRITV